jgi:hypothetical protein
MKLRLINRQSGFKNLAAVAIVASRSYNSRHFPKDQSNANTPIRRR